MTDRNVLAYSGAAYSGGLGTSVGIGWIAAETGAEVIAVAADVGQGGEDLEVIRQRALDCGAVETGLLEDPWNAPIEDVHSFTSAPGTAGSPDELVLSTVHGVRPRSTGGR